MKRLFPCLVVCLLLVGCLKPLSGTTLSAIKAKANDSPQDAALFKSINPKIQAQLKDGPQKADTIKYLNNLEKTLTDGAKSDQNIWSAIRDQHSLPK